MIQELLALGFLGEMSQATGVNLAVGVNVYVEEQDPFSAYTILIDPTSLSEVDESKLEVYSLRRGLRIGEAWNDWGRFLKVSKLRPEFVSAFSP